MIIGTMWLFPEIGGRRAEAVRMEIWGPLAKQQRFRRESGFREISCLKTPAASVC